MLVATLLNFAALLRPVRPPVVRSTAPRAALVDSLQEYLTTPAEELGTKSKETRDIDWLKQWYPLAHTRALRKAEPNAMRLLETPLVAWQSADGWAVAEDRCPHRGAPLSYGRLEANSTLTCSYHGWQFGSTGETAYVPVRRKQGCAASLRIHPSRVCEYGLLWVWPVSVVPGSAEEEAAFATKLPIDHLPAPGNSVTDWTVNRVPVPWASLLENTLDDAHGVHAHHGFAGLDRALARPASKVISGQVGQGESFVTWANVSYPLVASEAASESENQRDSWVNSYQFTAPHRTTVRFGPEFQLQGFIVPASYDETLLVSAAFSKSGPGVGGRLLKGTQLANPFLTAVLHRLGTTTVCQDAVLAEADGLDDLRGERWTGEKTRGGLTSSDGAVHRLRGWMRRSGGPPLRPARDDVKRWQPRHQLSVWEMHTRDCPTCRRAHDDAKATAKVLLVASVAAAASGQLPTALALVAHAELSRAVSRWFEVFDVRFDK